MDQNKPPPKMTVQTALDALALRPEQPRPRRPAVPSEHPWQFSDPAFNRMLDRGSDDFLNSISLYLGILTLVAHNYRGKPYTKEEVWEAALVAGRKHYQSDLVSFYPTDLKIIFMMIDDVVAGTYSKPTS